MSLFHELLKWGPIKASALHGHGWTVLDLWSVPENAADEKSVHLNDQGKVPDKATTKKTAEVTSLDKSSTSTDSPLSTQGARAC